MAMPAAYAGLLFLAGASTASANDALLDQALQRTALPPAQIQGMIRTTTTVMGGDKPEVETEMADPRKDPKKSLASYAELKDVIGRDARVAAHEAGRTTYTFTTRHVPRGYTQAGDIKVDMDGKDDDTLFDGKAEVSMDASGRPYVSHVDLRMHDAEGNMIAKVKKIDISYTFGPTAPTDAMVATAMSVEVEVRALFFVNRHARADAVLVASSGTTAAP